MKLSVQWSVAALAAVLATGAQAAPQKVQGGTLVLPTSGITISVADDPANDYMLSGSWAIDDKGAFDARDVIDELSAKSGALVRGNWVLSGYFTAANCDALLGELSQAKPWTATVTLWGASWQVRGGDYSFNNDIGTHPMTALCRIDGRGRGLLLQRFLIDKQAGMAKAGMLADLGQARVLAAAARGFAAGTSSPTATPLHQSNVTKRGTQPATRTLKLEKSKLELTLPDDGMVWLLGEPDEKAGTDRLDRVIPALPEISIDVLRYDAADCRAAFADLSLVNLSEAGKLDAAKPATGLPAGWTGGPVTPAGGDLERIFCTMKGKTALLAGYIVTRDSYNAAPIAPLLTALAAAKED